MEGHRCGWEGGSQASRTVTMCTTMLGSQGARIEADQQSMMEREQPEPAPPLLESCEVASWSGDEGLLIVGGGGRHHIGLICNANLNLLTGVEDCVEDGGGIGRGEAAAEGDGSVGRTGTGGS